MSKTYPFWLKALAAVAAIAVPIFIMTMFGSISRLLDDIKYAEFYDWDITDGSAEKIGDNVYHVTVTLKNHSAYRITLYDYAIQVYCNNNSITMNGSPYHDSRLLENLKYPVLPAGQTTQYSFDITLPQNAEYITLEYYGISYAKQEYMQTKETWRRNFLLEL